MNCISPIDGRYADITKPLSEYFSEFAFFRYRLYVEFVYFCELSKVIPELQNITSTDTINIMNIFHNFNCDNFNTIKEKEKIINHDIKALEYFIQIEFKKIGLEQYISFIHFAITSQDINTSANVISLKECITNLIVPAINKIIDYISTLSFNMKNDVMLAFTHGQPAVPTIMGKELYVFKYRLEEQLDIFIKMPFTTKFGGAIGNFNAHYAAYPHINWNIFSDNLVKNMGLNREKVTTQISNYDNLCNIFNMIKTINNIINDMNIDFWLYISKGYLKQKINDNEIGSSTMPQKVNPINFENSEGNICIANSIINGITNKLSISRLQRDLTDSTILRNIGTILSYSYISYESTYKGLTKIDINRVIIKKELMYNNNILAEGVQTILRKHMLTDAYEKLHNLTRNNFDNNKLNYFISSLPLNIQKEISNITLDTYYGKCNLLDI